MRRRRDTGAGPVTLQSCDNLQGNGLILRQTILGLARISNAELAAWIEECCAFPNSMVDCIVPVTGRKELELVRDFGISDAVPVTHENFRQSVIEDDFCAGRPSWERVGATLSDDVHAYEAMKIGILNGGHQLIANAGEILSIEHIPKCMAHPLIGGFFRQVTKSEIAPLVDPVPGMTPCSYVDLVDRRFSNPEIVDTVRRVAFDGSSRQTGFLLPTLRNALNSDKPIDGLVLSKALWARMCEGLREDGTAIEPNDPLWDRLVSMARAAKTQPLAWISQSDIYGDLIESSNFRVSSKCGFRWFVRKESRPHYPGIWYDIRPANRSFERKPGSVRASTRMYIDEALVKLDFSHAPCRQCVAFSFSGLLTFAVVFDDS